MSQPRNVPIQKEGLFSTSESKQVGSDRHDSNMNGLSSTPLDSDTSRVAGGLGSEKKSRGGSSVLQIDGDLEGRANSGVKESEIYRTNNNNNRTSSSGVHNGARDIGNDSGGGSEGVPSSLLLLTELSPADQAEGPKKHSRHRHSSLNNAIHPNNTAKRTSTSSKTTYTGSTSVPRLSACQVPPPPPERMVSEHMEHYQNRSVHPSQNPKKEERYHYFQRLNYPFLHPDEPTERAAIDVEIERISKELSGSVNTCGGALGVDSSVEDDEDREKVSALALSTFTDPVSGAGVYSVLLGDMKGDIEYVEISASDGNNRLIKNSRFVISNTEGSRDCIKDGEKDSHNQLTHAMSASIEKDLRHREVVRRVRHSAYVRSINALNSSVVDPGVKCLSFVPNSSPSVISYLTANLRMMKLFRIRREGFSPLDFFPNMEQVVRQYQESLPSYGRFSAPKRILPVKEFGPTENPIQQLSLCADCQTFMSVEDLQLFWWDMEASDSTKGSCIVNLTPPSGNLNEIEELVTAANFHPSHGSLFLMSRSTGVLNIGDLRDPPCRSQRKFGISTKTLPKHNTVSFPTYDEILCSISAASFLGNDYVVTRDYLSLKVWDLRRAVNPLYNVPVMDYMFPYLDFLYDHDFIFDRFPLALDSTSLTVVAGVYDRAVGVWQPFSTSEKFHFYRADPEDDPSNPQTNIGPVQLKDLQDRVDSNFDACKDSEKKSFCSSLLSGKVLSVDIAPGGERFAFGAVDGKHVFVFETDANKSHRGKASK